LTGEIEDASVYISQINVIDDIVGNYGFRRWPILIEAVGTTPTKTASSGTGDRNTRFSSEERGLLWRGDERGKVLGQVGVVE
jgi:hypothetical protein